MFHAYSVSVRLQTKFVSGGRHALTFQWSYQPGQFGVPNAECQMPRNANSAIKLAALSISCLLANYTWFCILINQLLLILSRSLQKYSIFGSWIDKLFKFWHWFKERDFVSIRSSCIHQLNVQTIVCTGITW